MKAMENVTMKSLLQEFASNDPAELARKCLNRWVVDLVVNRSILFIYFFIFLKFIEILHLNMHTSRLIKYVPIKYIFLTYISLYSIPWISQEP